LLTKGGVRPASLPFLLGRQYGLSCAHHLFVSFQRSALFPNFDRLSPSNRRLALRMRVVRPSFRVFALAIAFLNFHTCVLAQEGGSGEERCQGEIAKGVFSLSQQATSTMTTMKGYVGVEGKLALQERAIPKPVGRQVLASAHWSRKCGVALLPCLDNHQKLPFAICLSVGSGSGVRNSHQQSGHIATQRYALTLCAW
jgi:hypothetical protein